MTHDEAADTADPDRRELESLVAECLDRIETAGPGALEEFCTQHPRFARGIRRRVNLLLGVGMLDFESPAADAEPTSTPTNTPREPALAESGRLGNFRLDRPIATGGMGVIYVARQDGLDRDVALKLIRPDQMFFPESRERFRREVETISRLRHPGIVPIYTVGEEMGIPYFAMELVEGASLAEVVQELASDPKRPVRELTGDDFRAVVTRLSKRVANPSNAEQRTVSEIPALFQGSWVTVCLRIVAQASIALEYAHRHGVLHRDMKPSNIMVTPEGRVLILDFGLAASDGTQKLTQTGIRVGSLLYAPPEHLGERGSGFDVRSDVYAMGVTLYEILTLRCPFEETSAYLAQRKILEGISVPPRRINSEISRDAETVCLKSLAVDPSERYASIAAFGRDIDNVLHLRPIEGRRTDLGVRMLRYSQRHPARATSFALALVIAIGGPLLYAIQQSRARERIELARLETDRQRDRAEANLKRSLRAIEGLLSQVNSTAARSVTGFAPIRQAILEDAIRFLTEFVSDNAQHPSLDLEFALAWQRLGALAAELGQNDDAIEAYQSSITAFDELRTRFPNDPSQWGVGIRSRLNISTVLVAKGRIADAERVLRAGLEVAALAQRTDPELDSIALEVPRFVNNLAYVLELEGRKNEAAAAYPPAIESVKRVVEARPQEALPRRILVELLVNHGNLLNSVAETHEAALAEFDVAVAEARAAFEASPQDPSIGDLFALTLLNRANLEADRDRRRAMNRESAERFEHLIEQFPEQPLLRVHLALAYRNRSIDAKVDANEEEAFASAKRDVELCRDLVTRFESDPQYRIQLADSLSNLGNLNWFQYEAAIGCYDEGIASLQRAIELVPGLKPPRATRAKLMSRRVEVAARHRHVEDSLAYAELILADYSGSDGTGEFAAAMALAAAVMQATSEATGGMWKPDSDNPPATRLAAAALDHLNSARIMGYTAFGDVTTRPEFASLREYPPFLEFATTVRENAH